MGTPADEARLRALVAEVTRQDISSIDLHTDLVRELGLDSLAGLALLAAFEKRFDVRLPDERLSELRTLGSLLEAMPPVAESEVGR